MDRYKLEVAVAAVSAGATIINDVWGLTRSPGLADLAARHECALVLMHNQDGTEYAGDLMSEVKRFLRASVDAAVAAGGGAPPLPLAPRDGLREAGGPEKEGQRPPRGAHARRQRRPARAPAEALLS